MTIKWCMIHEIWSATEFLIIFGHFLPFYPPNSLKNENTKKMKKCLEISSFYTSVPKIMIVGYTVPEISHKAEGIIFHFRQFFALLHLKNEKNTWRYHHFTQYHKWQSYDIWFLRYEVQQTEFYCHLGPFFYPFTLPTARKMKISKNEKNAWTYHYFTQLYQKLWSSLGYTVPQIWRMKGVIIFHFWQFFALLPP